MKRINLLSLTMLGACIIASQAANAAIIGPYIGLGGGYGNYKSPDKPIFIVSGTGSNTNHAHGGLSGRAFVGMNFDPYVGVEGGFTRYARTLYQGSTFSDTASLSYYALAYDVVGKAYLPFGHTGFNLYAVAGAARVSVTTHFSDTGLPMNSDIAMPAPGKTHTYKTRPLYGAGLSYDFGQHISANVEFTQIRHSGDFATNPYAIPDMDLITANITYTFS